MSSRNALPLSTLFFIRDKNTTEAEAEPAASTDTRGATTTTTTTTATSSVRTRTAKQLDPAQRKLMALKLMGEIPTTKGGKQASTEIVTKDKSNVVWRQFMISRAAMLTNQR